MTFRKERQILAELHRSLDRRYRPEDVADLVLAALSGRLTRREQVVLERAAQHSLRRTGSFSSMSADYARPVGGANQVAAANRLFGRWVEADPDDPESLLEFAATVGQEIQWEPEHTDFLADRLNREAREAVGMDLSKRQYNRRFRVLRRIAAKATILGTEQDKRRLLMVGVTGFGADIPLDRFLADPDAACFVAYYTARRKTRREFSLSGRDNPFDEIAQVLLDRCQPRSDWWMIAQVRATPDVLPQLTDEERGRLLGQWSAVMRHSADLLRARWNPATDRTTMIVRRGDDSTTWNNLAVAYNAARSGWLACLASLDALELLDVACPGKVMRLMAADLAAWHRSTGGGVDPNTEVWAALPLPWEVLDGTAVCTRSDLDTLCRAAGLDPEQSGWTAPAPPSGVAVFRPTPELVHGVSIADPVWAALLRRAGAFSGRRMNPDLATAVHHGLTSGVVISDLPTTDK
ncbi:hypothetical protein GCM10009555_023710 [Acrocarpospora macrocephala]|uniref:Uncharacterized protein n=1 Tax=Acrocarpospora macrocephala TaxID=150177 RepID=A0A5M3X0Q7_9ACTN|nr:hypothetical protein [Acrocarpospora macrocephala]GES12303.1 hypothetical protein Amac_059000 [Acrocarpospora macrocephala]